MKTVSGGLHVFGVIDGDKGDVGDSAVVYGLLPSPDKVVFAVDANGDYTPSTGVLISCRYTKTVGGTTTSGAQTYNENGAVSIDRKYNIFYRLILDDGTVYNTSRCINGWNWLRYLPAIHGQGDTFGKVVSVELALAAASTINVDYVNDESRNPMSDDKIICRVTVPVIRDGSPGPPGSTPADGRDAAVLEVYSGNPVLFSTDSDGVTVGAQSKDVLIRIRTAGGTASPAAANITVASSFGNVAVTKDSNTNGKITLAVLANKPITEGALTVTATATIGGVSHTASGCIAVACNRMGLRGETGPWRYYDGPWKSDKTYSKTAGTPIVLGSDGHKYYLFGNSSLNEDPSLPTYQNGSPWQLTTEDFKFLVAEMVFSDNAQFSAFVFNTDWLISISGTINGARYYSSSKDSPATVVWDGDSVPAYTRFNPALPNGKMNVPVTNASIVSSVVTDNAYFDLPGGHKYIIAVTIAGRSSDDTDLSQDIYLRLVDNNENVRSKTVDHNGRFVFSTPYSPSEDVSLRICCVSQQGLSASVAAVEVTSTTAFIPNYAVNGLSGETYQNVAHISGEVTANRLLASDSLFSTEITPGVAEFRSILFPLSYLRIGADENGMVFQMTDKKGRLIWNLGGASNGIGSITSGGGDYTTVYYKQMTSRDPAVSEFSNVTQADCTAYYRYNGAWAKTSGGEVQFDTGEEALDGIVHTSKVKGANVNIIPPGYYVKPNNGLFFMEASIDDNDTPKKSVFIYHFVDGRITETITKEFY